MPQGDKGKYTDKQKRKAEHIAEGYEDRGVTTKTAKKRAWATVNKESGGGNKSGSGRGVPENTESSKKGGRKGGAATARKSAKRKSAKKKPGPKKGTKKKATKKRSTK
jgi:plasmid stabilization system protein ParE